MNNTLSIKILLGSVREGRFGEHAANWILERANEMGLNAEIIDLRDYPMPFFKEAVTPSWMQGDYDNEVVQRFTRKMEEGDAFVWVTPEYNHGYSAVLKNAIDYVYKAWQQKPVGMVAYGSVGGARAVEQLRQVAVELQMAPIRNAVHINAPWTLTENGQLKAGALDGYNDSGKHMLDQLVWWGNALKAARSA